MGNPAQEPTPTLSGYVIAPEPFERQEPYRVRFAHYDRRDPLVPYLTYSETDDGPQYKPGGRRYAMVGLALPVANGSHAMGLLLEFSDPDQVAALRSELDLVYDRLREQLTEADFQPSDATGQDAERVSVERPEWLVGKSAPRER